MSLISKIIGKLAPLISGSLSQEELRSDVVHGDPFENTPELTRKIASSGMVLLKNDNVLPLRDESFALFGRTAIDTFFVGYGSGGDVRAPYRVSILKGILDNGNLNVDSELVKVYEQWCEKNPTDNASSLVVSIAKCDEACDEDDDSQQTDVQNLLLGLFTSVTGII